MLNAVTVTESPNPDLIAACGIRVVLVLDESGSIQEEGAIGNVRQAANVFIESLADTGSEVAVVEFNTHARTPIPFTPVTAGPTGTITTLFRPYVNDTSGGEGYNPGDYPYGLGLRTTNWDDAFEKVQTLNQGSNRAPLVVFVTDGDPTSYNLDKPGDPPQLNPAGLPGIGGNGLTTDWPTLGRAVEGVNLVRAAGTHVLGVGVGNAFTSAASEKRLKLITGPQKYTGGTLDLKTTDYTLVTNFADLKAALRAVAVELCGNSLTITKKLDADGDGIFEPAPGWHFTGSVHFPAPTGTAYTWVSPNPAAIPGEPITASTDENGTVTFQWVPQAAGDSLISIQEALPTGYQFVGLSCMYTTPDNAIPQTLSVTQQGNGLLATMGSLWIATCEFSNLAEPTPTPTLTPTLTPTSTLTSTPVIYKVYLPLISQELPPSTPTPTPTPTPIPPIVIEGLQHPKGIGINLANHRLYVASRDTDVVYEVNPLDGTVVRSILVGDEPFGVAVNTTTNKIYVANYRSNTVSVINGATGKVIRTISLWSYRQPSYVAINEVTNRIYVSLHGDGRLAVINGATDTLETTVEVGAGAFGVAADPVRNRVFVSCRDANWVRVINGATNEVLWDQTIHPGGTPYALGIDPGLERLYVSFAPLPDDPSQVLAYRIPATGPSLTGAVLVGHGGADGGGGVAANPITHHVFVTNAAADTVSVFDGDSLLLLATAPTGDDPMGVAVDPGLNYAFVGNRASNNLTSIPDTY